MKRNIGFLVFMVGCGGTTGAVAVDRDAGAPGADAAPEDAAPAPNDGGAAPTEAGPDATPLEEPIDPLVVGHKWTFEVTQAGFYPVCPGGMHDVSILSRTPRDGKDAYAVQSFCTGLPPLYYAEEGDVVEWDEMGTWVLVLDAPVQEGHSWTNGLTTYVWHDVGSFTVPAGTFAKCFKAEDTAGPSYSVLCRGIGPVKMVYRDGAGNGYDAVLRAKSF